jgi:hypothetical protein
MGWSARALFTISAVTLLACTVQAQQAAKPAPPQPAVKPDPGAITDGIYRNLTFGFTYREPFGWVDRTREMREDSNEDSSADSNSTKKSILLLATFERPPEATGNTVNSAVVVAAEEVASYPGLRSAEQYFGPLTELTKAKGLTVVNEPYEFQVGDTQLVRGDFRKPRANLTMHQSTLVMMEKGYVVSFTFIAGSEGEADQLVEGLSFSRKETPASHK